MEPKKGLTRLHKLSAKEVSLVPEGANGKRFMIFKEAGGKLNVKKSVSDELHKLISKTDPSKMSMVDEMMKPKVEKAPEEAPPPPPPPAAGDAGAGPDEQAVAAVKAVVRILSPFQGKIDPALMHNILNEIGFAVDNATGEGDHGGDAGSGDVAPSPDAEATEDANEAGAEADDDSSSDDDSGDEGDSDEGDDDDSEDTQKSSDDEDEEEDMEKSNRGRDDFFGDQDDEDQDPDEGDEDDIKVGKSQLMKAQDASAEGMASWLQKAMEGGAQMSPELLAKAKAYGAECYKQCLAKLGPQAEEQQAKPDGKPVAKGKMADPVKKSADAGKPAARSPEVEQIFKANKELVQKNADLEKRIKDIEAGNLEKEIVAKAASFTHLGLPQEDIVAQLKDAHKNGSEAFERVTKNFTQLNEQGKTSGIFKEHGSSLPANGNDTWAHIEQAAMSRVAKSGERRTKEQAVSEFLETDEGKKMYQEHQASRKDGI